LSLVPLFLFAARHMKEDIAGIIAEAQARYPGLRWRVARHLGVDARLLEILADRLSEVEPAATHLKEQTAILLVGRGSSYPEGNAGIYEVAERFRACGGYPWIETCFAGLAEPRVAESLRRAVEQGAERVVALPYLLFTGVLIKRIASAMQA